MDHGRLFKVIYKDKKFSNSVDIAKELFPEEYLKKGVAIADDKFNTPSPSSDQQQKVFSCKICKTKETKLDDIKRHYLLQHYKENLLSYPFLRKNISYPTKCLRAKDGCVKELANLDEYW